MPRPQSAICTSTELWTGGGRHGNGRGFNQASLFSPKTPFSMNFTIHTVHLPPLFAISSHLHWSTILFAANSPPSFYEICSPPTWMHPHSPTSLWVNFTAESITSPPPSPPRPVWILPPLYSLHFVLKRLIYVSEIFPVHTVSIRFPINWKFYPCFVNRELQWKYVVEFVEIHFALCNMPLATLFQNWNVNWIKEEERLRCMFYRDCM